MHASFVDLGLCDGMLQSFKIFIFSLKYSLVWNEIKNVKQQKIYRLSSLGGVKEIVWKVLQFSWKKKRKKEKENIRILSGKL